MSRSTVGHTKGPWTADWDDSGQWYVNIGGLCVSGNALRGDSGECVESANAHLIAAAPLMYAALKSLLTFPRSLEYRALAEVAAHDAIAQAEGRSARKIELKIELLIRDDIKPGYYLRYGSHFFSVKSRGVDDINPTRFLTPGAARITAGELDLDLDVVEVA